MVNEAIVKVLHDLEAQQNILILYACEAGSRAWGFPSPDSDWDVRFIYARPQEHYLTFDVEHQRDVIEPGLIGEIDISGWDIRKALYLLARTNGALIEWLHSPTVYLERGGIAQQLRSVLPNVVSMTALCFHYSHMAKRNAREYLKGDVVRLKKYLYVIRPLLAIRFIDAFGVAPPVSFDQLVAAAAPVNMEKPIADLLETKKTTVELGTGLAIPALNQFISEEIERHEGGFSGQGRPVLQQTEARAELQEIFRQAIDWRQA